MKVWMDIIRIYFFKSNVLLSQGLKRLAGNLIKVINLALCIVNKLLSS